MKTKIVFVIAFVLQLVKAEAQVSYAENIQKAWGLYQQKDYLASAKAYSSTFAMSMGKGTQDDWYNGACSWALAGNIDSAIHYLQVAAEKFNYYNYGHITTDTDLNAVHADHRWEKILKKVKENKT